jgi:riboflavin transporter FmnP
MTNLSKEATMDYAGLRKFTKIIMFGTISFLLTYFSMPIFPQAAFLRLNLSCLPALVLTLSQSISSGILVLLIKLILTLLLKSISIGRLASFASDAAFIIGMGSVYKIFKYKGRLILSLICGVLSSTAVGSLLNYYVFLPSYGYAPNLLLGAVYNIFVPFSIIKNITLSLATLFFHKYTRKILD